MIDSFAIATIMKAQLINIGLFSMKMIHGVAFNSRGKHRTGKCGKPYKVYQLWADMIKRCYSDKYHEKNPAYVGCTVCPEWLDFQNFAEWYDRHEYKDMGYQLDKDLLTPKNKIYSPETCCFVPQELNMLIVGSGVMQGEYPTGIYWNKPAKKYLAQVNMNGKLKTIGVFSCPNEAHRAYREVKQAYVKEKAVAWKDKIDPRVFDALMNWTVE